MTAKALIGMMRATEKELANAQGEMLNAVHMRLKAGIDALEETVDWLVSQYASDVKAAVAGSVPFLMLVGVVSGGWQMARAALVAQKKLTTGSGDTAFYQAKLGTARFYADHELTRASALKESIVSGAVGVLALSEDQF